MAKTKTHHPKKRRSALPNLQGLNVWGVILDNGEAGAVTIARGGIPSKVNGHAVVSATSVGNTAKKAKAAANFNKWTQRHASFLLEQGGSHGTRTIFNQAMGHGGALGHLRNEATGDPIPGIAFVTAVTLGTGTALGIPAAIAGEGAAGGAAAGEAAAGAGAGEAAAGGAGGGGLAGTAGKIAGGAAAASVAGIFTDVGWWKGLGMIVIGVVLGVLAIREFSP